MPQHVRGEVQAESGALAGSEVLLVSEERPCSCYDTDNEDQFCYPTNWTLKDVEKSHIMQVVDSHDGNKSAAARQLGVARKTLERKYKDWADESA